MTFVIALLLTARAALADDSLFCHSPETLLEATGGCEGNTVFLEASKACLAKLNDAEVSYGQQIVAGAKLAKAGQSQDTLAARQGYDKTIQAMTRLQGMAEQGRGELAGYEPYLALPGLEMAPLLARDGSLNSAAALSAGCYANGLRGLRGGEAEFDAKIAMYRARREEATAAAKALDANLGNFRAATSSATSSLGAAAKGHGSGSPVPAGKSPRSQSQITGKIPAARPNP